MIDHGLVLRIPGLLADERELQTPLDLSTGIGMVSMSAVRSIEASRAYSTRKAIRLDLHPMTERKVSIKS